MGKLVRVKTSETKEEVFRIDCSELDGITLNSEVIVINFTAKSEKDKKVFNFDDIVKARECYNYLISELGLQADN